MRATLALLVLILATSTAQADMTARDGWSVTETGKSYTQLISDVKSAVKANKMGVVTQAGPTGAAKARGITIPGNRVIGVFNNIYAVNILELSTAAMIEAPVRLYVTENADGTATLSYKLPSTIFAPYVPDAGPALATLAAELDMVFAAIAQDATK